MKAGVDKLDINKQINVLASLNNSKLKVNDLLVAKLKTVHVDLKKTSNIVVKNTKFNKLKPKINYLNKKIPVANNSI